MVSCAGRSRYPFNDRVIFLLSIIGKESVIITHSALLLYFSETITLSLPIIATKVSRSMHC